MGKRLDLTNQKFNRLYVLEFAGMNKRGQTTWKCLCDCGNTLNVAGHNLNSGNTKSCGCLNIEAIIKRNKLGHSKETRQKMRGKKHSIESRRKISEARKGKYCGKNHPMYGKFGKDAPAWNPNLTDEDRMDRRHIPGYKEWVQTVLKRDNYTCQVCGKRGGGLIAHHLESYRDNPKLRTTLSNGITLCKDKCHKDFHHQYGYGHNTRKQFIQFKEEITCAICPHS